MLERCAMCAGTGCKWTLCCRCLFLSALVEYFVIKICVTSFYKCGEFTDKHIYFKRFVRRFNFYAVPKQGLFAIYHPYIAACI